MGSKSLCFVFVFVGLSCAVVVPISRGGREHSVIQGFSGNSSDSAIDKLIRVAGDYGKSVGVLEQVDNPGTVAKELEEDVEYLKRRVEVERNGTGGEEEEIRRVLDGLVYFTGFYDGGLRPGGWSGVPTTVTVEAVVHPWFSFDERRNALRLSVTLTQVWDDERVAFKGRLKVPGGVKEVTLTSHMNHIEIWTPDTYVLNGKGIVSRDGVVRVSAEGNVLKEHRMSLTVRCASSEVKSFPFEKIVCPIRLGSYTWNSSEVIYKWSGKDMKNMKDVDGFEWSGYRVLKVKTFEIEQGSKSGLSLEFHLERGLSRFVYRFYLPLGCLCLVGILGLLRGVQVDGGLVCCTMIGVMNVFMGLSYGWEDMGWRFSRNSMDSYFGYCVFTVFACFVVNIIRGRNGPASKCNGIAGHQESYEMEDNGIGRRNKPSRSNGFFRESSGEADVSRSTEITRASSVIKSFRVMLGKGLGVLGGCCIWMDEFSVVLMVGFFVSWNCFYWGANLMGR